MLLGRTNTVYKYAVDCILLGAAVSSFERVTGQEYRISCEERKMLLRHLESIAIKHYIKHLEERAGVSYLLDNDTTRYNGPKSK
jgi:hypothetical protein